MVNILNPGNFQTQVNVVQPIGTVGDFASANPRATLLAGAGAMVAGPLGLTIGRFCWTDMSAVDDLGAAGIVNSYGTGPVAGFVRRNQQALITAWLDGTSLIIPPGIGVGDIFIAGDFLCINDGATVAVPGQKAYANFQNGKVNFAAAGAASAGATSTGSTITPEAPSATGTIAGNVFTAVSGLSGNFYPGTTLSGTGVVTGTKIVSQVLPLVAGEALNGLGRYNVSIGDQSVASTTITGAYGLLTIGTATGVFHVGDVLSATGSVVAGTTITASVTGNGGTGATMIVDNNTNVGSQAINVAAINVETKWYARSPAQPGELVKISSYPLG